MELREWLVDERNRRLAIIVGLVVGPVLLGAVIGTVLGSGASGGNDRVAVVARLAPLSPGAVIEDPSSEPSKLSEPRGLGSEKAGVAVVAASQVRSANTSKGERSAPVGGNLLAFTLADWTCEIQPCESWRSLDPKVERDGAALDLPKDGDTFVVALPPGTVSVDLVVDNAGAKQTLQLLGDDVGAKNIRFLAAKGDPAKKIDITKAYRLVESTSIMFTDSAGNTRNQFTREVKVDWAQRRYFLNGEVPSNPARVFLVVNLSYAYQGNPARYAFDPAEIRFTARDGRVFAARDLDPDPEVALLGFEIPAGLKGGAFSVGGVTDKTSTSGIPYTSTMQTFKIPLSFK